MYDREKLQVDGIPISVKSGVRLSGDATAEACGGSISYLRHFPQLATLLTIRRFFLFYALTGQSLDST